MKDYILKSGFKAADFEVDGIDYRDYPEFCDAFIYDASVEENGEWREATEAELDELNEDSDLVYECVEDYLY